MNRFPVFIHLAVLCGLSISGNPARAADDPSPVVSSDFIYEKAPYPSCHASTIAETSDGALVAAWFGGAKEGASDVGIWLARREPGAAAWSEPVEVAKGTTADGQPTPCWNPVLFQPDHGPPLLFFKVGPTFLAWWGMMTSSADGGRTWAPARRLPDGILGPIKNKPVQLPGGELVCGSSTEPGGWRVHFERTPDLGATWTATAPINDGKAIGAIQPSLLPHPGGKLQALGRSQQGRLWQAWSEDGGKTWGEMTLLDVPNPNSGTDAVALRDGRFLLVYNHTPRGRTPLNVAVSDDGVRWSALLTLENGDGEFSYPAVIQTRDGLIHLTYTWKRQRIRHVVLDPEKLRVPPAPKPALSILRAEDYRHFADEFNAAVPEDVANAIPNALAWNWLTANAPFFDCPDAEFLRTYYYRWWVFRRHLKHTPGGWNMSEFILPVNWADSDNAISASAALDVMDGRWLRDPRPLAEVLRYWLTPGADGKLREGFYRYSNSLPDAAWQRYLADGRREEITGLLPGLVASYAGWEERRRAPDGLFWQYDVSDGMEESISGSRQEKNRRAPLNAYLYGTARAVAATARLAGQPDTAREFDAKAVRLKERVQTLLWDKDAQFYKVRHENGALSDARELHGYLPWLFGLPDPGQEAAWKQFSDPQGFSAPFGLTTAEQRHPKFAISYAGHDCQWNGPVWPFATSQTLAAAANLLNDYPPQDALTPAQYFAALQTYAHSQRLKLPDGRVLAWIDENQDPFTGAWIARDIKRRQGDKDPERGAQYLHSFFTDLVISGLAGVRPREGNKLIVNPLLPPGTWDWFCLDGVPYHGRLLTILWDKDGTHYHRGAGLMVWSEGLTLASRPDLGRLETRLLDLSGP